MASLAVGVQSAHAFPVSDVNKEVRNVTDGGAFGTATDATPGERIEFRITYTNSGDTAGTDSTVTDQVPDDTTLVSCTPACGASPGSGPGTALEWNLGTMDPGESAQVSFVVDLDGDLAVGDTVTNVARGESSEELHPIDSNEVTVTIVGGTTTTALTITKSADVSEASAGDLVTYTFAFANTGDAAANDVVVEDTRSAGATFVSCSDGCQQVSSTTVRWNLGTLAAGASGSVTLTIRVTDTVGCQLCDTATLNASNTPHPVSDTLCIETAPAPQPEGANASGSAFGAHANVTTSLPLVGTVVLVDETLVPVSSSQSGIGSDSDSDVFLNASISTSLTPVLEADVLSTSATSTVTASPAEARQTSVAETANVDVLNGVVKARLVRGVASTTATGTSSSFSSTGSMFEGLQIDLDGAAGPMQPQAIDTVNPNTRIDLPSAIFGSGSHIVLFERNGSTSRPPSDQLSGGTYAADLEVNMIKVVVTNLVGQAATVVVSNAKAHSDFPQTTLCEAGPRHQGVSGHAFVLSAQTDPSVLPTTVGFTSIPVSGGFDRQELASASVPADGSTADSGTAVSETSGELTATTSTASSFAEIENLCVLRSASGDCAVAAQLVRSESNSSADAGGAQADDGDGDGDGDTTLVGVVVGGQIINQTPAPNTVVNLPGIGFLILNEQFCDNQPTPTSAGPVSCTGASSTGRTVRALRLVVTQGLLPIGAEVIVAEAHSDALFVE